jgi:hypothetical protein
MELVVGMVVFVLVLVLVVKVVSDRRAPDPVPQIEPPPAPKPQPPAARQPMRVMQIRSTAFLRIEGPDGKHDEQVPASPHGHGEYPQGVWRRADGTVFLPVKQYTGRPGPDDGVILRRMPDGVWDVFHREDGRFFCTVAGAGEELYVGSIEGVYYFDGSAWKFVPIDAPGRTEVYVREGRVFGASNHRQVGWSFERGEATPSALLPPQSWNECEVTEDGVTYTAFHKQVDLGEVDLSSSEEAEIRGELVQVAQLIKEGKVRTSKSVS